MSAPFCLMHVLRRQRVAGRLRHLVALLVDEESAGDDLRGTARRLRCRCRRAATTGTSRDAGRALRCRRRSATSAPDVLSARRGASSRSRTRRRGCPALCGTRCRRTCAGVAVRQEIARRTVVPGVGAFGEEELLHLLEQLRRRHRLAARFAIKNGDRNAPQCAGARCTSRGGSRPCRAMRSSPHAGNHFTLWTSSSARRAQVRDRPSR